MRGFAEVLNDNCGHYTFTVPQNIAPGNYLIRAEVIGMLIVSSFTLCLTLDYSTPCREQCWRCTILYVVLPS